MGKSQSKDRLLSAMRGDQENEIKQILEKEPNLKDDYINAPGDHTALIMAGYFGSFVATKILFELGADVNKPEKREGSSPLIIAAKRNQKNIFNFLLQNGAEINHRNNLNLNALDYAIIHGNYEIAYNLKHNNKDLNLKSLDEYIQLNRQMQVPCFNIPVFYQSLLDDVEPTHTPSFVLTNEERKNMEGKIPDPNETWGDFFKRMLKFELYKPPMIDKKDVAFKDRSTFYMTVQTKLLEMEYNKEINLWDDDPHIDIESSRKKSQADKSQIELNSKFDKQEVLQIPISTVRSDGNIESMPKELEIVESHEQERHKNLAIKDSA